MLRLMHRLFPWLHRYEKRSALVLVDGVIVPFPQRVCRCGAIEPL